MIGISSPVFSLFSFEEMFTSIADRDVKLWEIVAEGKHAIPLIREIFPVLSETHDIEFQIHAPLSDINIASVNPRIRELSIYQIEEVLAFANAHNIRIVTIHPGHLSPLGVLEREVVAELNRNAIEKISALSEEYGVSVALENMPPFWSTLCYSADEIISLIEGTKLGICFDVGHAHLCRTISSFLSHKDKIINVHIHDNDGKKDKHMVLGKGTVDFRAVISGLKGYQGNWIVEGRGLDDCMESLTYLKDTPLKD